MSGRYLLDTNIIIALFANDIRVLQTLAVAKEVIVSTIVLGELYYDARNSQRVAENLAVIEQLRMAIVVLPCDALVATSYGELKLDLKKAGTPLPENDIWIAATARTHNLILVSQDQHFASIKPLTLEIW